MAALRLSQTSSVEVDAFMLEQGMGGLRYFLDTGLRRWREDGKS